MRYEGDTIDKLEEITNNQLEIEKKENKKENPVPLMELELRKMNKINKSKKQNNYISNVNPLDIIKGEKEVQVFKNGINFWIRRILFKNK